MLRPEHLRLRAGAAEELGGGAAQRWQPWIDEIGTVLGELISGSEVLDRLATSDLIDRIQLFDAEPCGRTDDRLFLDPDR